MKIRTNDNITLNYCKGSTSVIIICSILFTILFAAVLTDISYAAAWRYILTNTAQSAAESGFETLSGSRVNAMAAIRENAISRINDLDRLDVNISEDNSEISVKIGRPFQYLFLGIIGFKGKEMTGSATVRLSEIGQTRYQEGSYGIGK